MRRVASLILLASFAAASLLVGLSLPSAGAQQSETRVVDLAQGWNLVG
jgi:hypothetical protein